MLPVTCRGVGAHRKLLRFDFSRPRRVYQKGGYKSQGRQGRWRPKSSKEVIHTVPPLFLVRVCDVRVCGVSVLMYTETRREQWASCFIYNSWPYSCVAGFVIESRVRLSISKSQQSSFLLLMQCKGYRLARLFFAFQVLGLQACRIIPRSFPLLCEASSNV